MHQTKYNEGWIRLMIVVAGLGLLGCGGGGGTPTPDAALPTPDAPTRPDAPVQTVHKALYYIGDNATGVIELRELPLGEATSNLIYGNAGQTPSAPLMVANKLYFTLRNDDTAAAKVWVFDPTAPIAANLNPHEAFAINGPGVDDSPYQFSEHEGKLYFAAIENGSPHHTYVYDPAAAVGPSNPKKLFDQGAQFPVFAAGKMIFRASGTGTGEELFSFDLAAPASATNPTVFDLMPGSQSAQPRDLTVLGTKVYFGADNELYVYDPAAAGSATNPKIVSATNNSGASSLTAFGGKLFYEGSPNYSATGSELMVYDPAVAISGANPKLVEILPGSNGSSPGIMCGVGTKVAMSAYRPDVGRELFVFNPAAPLSASNPELIDILAGAADSDPRSLVADGNTAYFTVNVVNTGTFLVAYDSTMPTNVTVNPRSIYMTPGQAYYFHIGSYLK
jgi:hypothetical protein